MEVVLQKADKKKTADDRERKNSFNKLLFTDTPVQRVL